MIRPCNLVVILMDITDQEAITRHTVILVIRRRGIMEAILVLVRRGTISAEEKTENILEMDFTPPSRMLPITITQDILTRPLFLGNELDLIPTQCYTKAQRIR